MKSSNLSAKRSAEIPILTFLLSNQYYALPIVNVVEVAAMVNLTHLSNTQPEVLGAANRHGDVLSMLDLRHIMEREAVEIDDTTLFIVATDSDGEMVGLVVDHILQVEYITQEQLRKAGVGRYIHGIISYDDRLIQVLELTQIIDDYLSGAIRFERDQI